MIFRLRQARKTYRTTIISRKSKRSRRSSRKIVKRKSRYLTKKDWKR